MLTLTNGLPPRNRVAMGIIHSGDSIHKRAKFAVVISRSDRSFLQPCVETDISVLKRCSVGITSRYACRIPTSCMSARIKKSYKLGI